MDAKATRKPQHARCTECNHVWIVAYMPMELGMFAAIMRSAHCPMCAATSRALTLAAQPEAQADGEVSAEDRFEQFVQQAIAKSPEPLRELGEYLSSVLDEDEWPKADRLMLQLATNYTTPPPGAVPARLLLDASILREAGDVLEAVGVSGVQLPENWRWPLADELRGMAAMLAAAPGPKGEG